MSFNYKKFLKEGGIEKYLMEADFSNDPQDRYDYIRPLMSRLPDTARTEYLIDTLPSILKNNPNTEVFWVPRINTVQGITREHIKKWGWNMDNDGRINFPDYQCRILQNTPTIQWVSKVHEVLYGHKSQTQLPSNDEFCLIHPKSIKRQEHQNKFYNTI